MNAAALVFRLRERLAGTRRVRDFLEQRVFRHLVGDFALQSDGRHLENLQRVQHLRGLDLSLRKLLVKAEVRGEHRAASFFFSGQI